MVVILHRDAVPSGVLMWTMWYGQEPYQDMSAVEVIHAVAFDGIRPPFFGPQPPPQSLIELIERCWSNDPDDRPAIPEVQRIFSEVVKGDVLGWELPERGKASAGAAASPSIVAIGGGHIAGHMPTINSREGEGGRSSAAGESSISASSYHEDEALNPMRQPHRSSADIMAIGDDATGGGGSGDGGGGSAHASI